MTLAARDLEELSRAIADGLYIQIAGWHLYLGDAGLAQTLAIECAGRLEQGAAICARQALEAVQVPIGGGATRLPLARLIPAGQLRDLEELLQPFCRQGEARRGRVVLIIEVTNARDVVRKRMGVLGSRLIGKVVDAEAQVEKALIQELENAFRDFGIEARIYSVDGPQMLGRSHLEIPLQVRDERQVGPR